MGELQYKHVDISRYLDIEQSGDVRYEYHKGELFAMAGGTINHSTVCNNVAGELRNATRKTGSCVSFNSEIKVEVDPGKKYVYPDAGLARPKLNESETLTGAITNPSLIVEVTSDSSGNYDRGAKLKLYFSLPSLQEYLIIDQDRPIVTAFRRRGNLMRLDTYSGLEDAVPLESIEASLQLSDIYENVELLPLEDDRLLSED